MKKTALYIFSLIIALNSTFCQTKITAKKGVLDLTNWNFNKSGLSDLNGEWEFYWNALYTQKSFDSLNIKPSIFCNVPSFWNSLIPGKKMLEPGFGYATYKLKVLCPPVNEKLNLKFLTIASAYKLFVNGKEILNVGKVGTTKATSTPSYMPVIVPVLPENNVLNIVIQVSNFNYKTGGIWDFIKLGTEQEVRSYWLKNILWSFYIAGSFFLIGIFYFVIYFFFRRGKASLYFAVFCILLSMRPLVTDEIPIHYVTHWSWQFIKHIEFLCVYLSVPVLALFSYELFNQDFSKKILRFILIASAPFVAAAIFTTPFIFNYILRPFNCLMFVTACYGLYVYAKAIKNKRTGSIYFFAGFIVLFLTIINDLLYNLLIIHSANLIYIGLLIFVICQAASLSRQFFSTFLRLEEANKKLLNINDELIAKNNTINETNNQLSKLNAELDSLVFRTSHDLRSPLTSVLALIYIIKDEKDFSKRSEYLDLQKKTLLRLDSFITDILDFSKNKRTELDVTEVDFNIMIKEILEDHIFSEQSESIEKMVEVQQQAIFKTDINRLKMIINNLVSNALRYHNKNLERQFLSIIVNATSEHAEILVSDNGLGIDEKHLPHIFKMFYRANKNSGGSGLGLYIVKEALEKLGGTIEVESKLQEGTKFIVTIPNNNH